MKMRKDVPFWPATSITCSISPVSLTTTACGSSPPRTFASSCICSLARRIAFTGSEILLERRSSSSTASGMRAVQCAAGSASM